MCRRITVVKSVCLFTALLLLMPTLGAQSTNLKVGDAAPDFELPDQNGNAVRLGNFKGKQKVVVAFYVLAFTGG